LQYTSISPGALLANQDSYPAADDTWNAVAGSAAQSVNFRAWNTCATTPKGYERVGGDGAVAGPTTGAVTATANCSTSAHSLGGGLQYTSITPGALLVNQDSYPAADDAWNAVAGSAAEQASFRAWTTCAPGA
jgi:hypothetical protein